ncbi:DUF2905 domain-containing protein [Pontiellaceae bacterium B12227]|nr:DUF2905 domain-containing protein [Pontiellaceae bacterium B12227]
MMSYKSMAIWVVFVAAFLLCKRFIPWFGNLPGDIEIQKENFHMSFPLASCVLLSLLLSLLFSIVRRL